MALVSLHAPVLLSSPAWRLRERLGAAPRALKDLPPPTLQYLAAMVAVRWRQMTEMHRVDVDGVACVVLFDEIEGTFDRIVDPRLGRAEPALVAEMERLISSQSPSQRDG